MRYYETLYLINPTLADEDYKGVVDKYNDILEKNKGVLTKLDEWGKRSLAYQVKKFDKGYYVLLQYCGDPLVTRELHRELKLDERILKYQTIKLSDRADPDKLKDQDPATEEKVSKETVPETESKAEEEGNNGIQ
jgi:small subunit ribosomal protein S6